MNSGRVRLERAVRRRIDTLAPVVPADPIARARVVVDNLLYDTSAWRPLGRFRLNENAVSG
jgi:hypothetical protein